MLLNKTKILVTRPIHQAKPLCKLIESIGGVPIKLPAIDIIKIENNWQDYDFNDFDMAIFISANAVNLSKVNLPTKLKLFAVGKATAEALQKLGLTVFCPKPPFNSETLLLMPQLQTITNKKIVIFRGDGGRELLAENLRQRGATVQYISVYKRVQPPIPTNKIYADITIVTSGEGLQNLLIMLQQYNWLRQNPMIVISERLAKQAKQLGIKGQIFIADSATDAGLFKAISQVVTNKTLLNTNSTALKSCFIL